ncbi:MAG: ATP-dependent RecD-like DNA helicase [Clostridia bacterium]|nr:ATP-dependent RecD-like DNA helicase [Clostridia bacterium]
MDDNRTESAQDNEGLLTLEGTVEHIVYQNKENGYCVCLVEAGIDEPVTVVGIMPFVSEGEQLRVEGKWEVHASYGRQFKALYYEKQLPVKQNDILRYLASRTVKGIGPKTAERIVEKFGDDSFDVIENHPDWLAEIPGISKQKALEISENFKEQFGMRSVMMFCREFFGPATTVKIYKKWGSGAVDIIRENPYILCDEIYGIGFERADRVAQTLGIDGYSNLRTKAAIKYILSYNASNNGHAFIPEDKLATSAAQMLGISYDDAQDAIDELIGEDKLKPTKIKDRRCIYLKSYYEAEKYIAAKIDLLDRVCTKLDDTDVNRFIEQLELEESIEYAALQKQAIKCAINSGVMVLTGGPGTGKTTVIRGVMRVFDRLGYEIALAAPTGRAAKRMSEATQREAKTIHRMLEMEYADDSFPRFRRDDKNLLEEHVIIIDEASMIDTAIMAALLKAIKPGARLILIGDADQLPSVGAGNVMGDIIDSERINTVKLTEIFRQARESLIITNAHAINNGQYPDLETKSRDFFFINRETDEDITGTIADLCVRRLPQTYGEAIRDTIQVISPSRKSGAGTDMLNIRLQAALNPPDRNKREKKLRGIVFREGDKVMQTRNNYDIEWTKSTDLGGEVDGIGIFNGDIGTILEINPNAENVTIRFDDRVAVYDFTMLEELEHAFAITVHKSQGSEYPVVIIPAYDFTPMLLTRNLLYTAVTRAQQMVIIVGKQNIVKTMVDNNKQTKRYTGLGYLLKSYEH